MCVHADYGCEIHAVRMLNYYMYMYDKLKFGHQSGLLVSKPLQKTFKIASPRCCYGHACLCMYSAQSTILARLSYSQEGEGSNYNLYVSFVLIVIL